MKNQRGAIVVEASIALTAFIFAIFTILSVVDICFTQAKVGIALNTAAKEISQYSYMYYALNVQQLDAKLHQGTEESEALASDTITGIDHFMDSLANSKQELSNGNIDQMLEEIQSGVSSVDSLVTRYGESIKKDPKGFIIGMAKMAGDQLKEEAKTVLASVLAKCFMEKNLKTGPTDTADSYLRRNHVKDGMDGLDFNYTTFLVGGESNVIQLVVTYDIQVIKLLNVDVSFKIRQCSKTLAWGNGVSSLTHVETQQPAGSNLWTQPDQLDRGKQIVENEKKEYDYVSSGQGFDAYEKDSNTFVTIISTNTLEDSYQTEQGIKNRLSQAYSELYNNVSGLDQEIELEKKDGSTEIVDSDPDTRNYKIVMVVPEDADRATVENAIREFEESHPGVTVEVKYAYGNAAPPESSPSVDPSTPGLMPGRDPDLKGG